jgi:hypothetical protein
MDKDATVAFRQRSADLILKLYEQRRDPALRSAREWFATQFNPENARDIAKLWVSEESAAYRMVTTYWEMAATFVTSGAIDAAMFHASNTEYVAIWSKIGPYLAELRKIAGLPDYLTNLEQVVKGIPDGGEKMAAIQKFLAHPARRKAGFSS